ncbi:hypothetical protein AMTR_s00185p00043310 [Amborella trichopoda]|uniref:DUF7963 domain-containing protein n=1 Tax=Amborella trichopoda TaxID=13333 RepID=U5CWD4_AMBTC|nr:hypothetical protein AMTR_s00185p00043310 [Amborella trichopoda]
MLLATLGLELYDVSAKEVLKRYEGLTTVRLKAIKGKEAWYWVHLEPILVQNPDTGAPKAIKLRCSLCNSLLCFQPFENNFRAPKARNLPQFADRFKAKALRNLEFENHWIVNLSCQFQGSNSLIKDFGKQLPLFREVAVAGA